MTMKNTRHSQQHAPYKLAVLMSHPIQYHAPLMRHLAAHPEIDLTVYYMTDLGIREAIIPEYGIAMKWDVPLLEGYKSVFLRNWSRWKDKYTAWSTFNPGIVLEIWRNEYDALLIYSYIKPTDLMAMAIAKLTRIPVFFRGDVLLHTRVRGLKARLKDFFLRLWFGNVNVVLPIGTRATEFYHYYGVPDTRLIFAPYAVNNEFFMGEIDRWHCQRDDQRKEIGIPPDMPVILFVALMRPVKRASDVIQAFEQAVPDKSFLLMVGSGSQVPELEQYCKEKHLKNVLFTGHKNQSELAKYYALADLFVISSESETWGLVVNEAMCAGLGVLASEGVASAIDLVIPERNGYIYPVGDITTLAKYMTQLVNAPELRQRMGACSRAIIEQWNYGADVQAILKALRLVTQK
jgi:glycosyltransferase involved in cell wall biosynthesis